MSADGHALQKQWTRGIVGFLALAVVLRLVRALQDFPMWCDETMLAANLLDRNWTELAHPLDYRQVCPLGFLALEWLAVRIFGFSELSLRLIPMICALASVPLFYLLARWILGRGTAGTFVAVAIFSVSEPLIRYAGEAKPYEADFLVSLVLLCLSVSWLRAPRAANGLWLLAAAVPLAVSVSLPSVFTIGAICVVLLYELLRGARNRRPLPAPDLSRAWGSRLRPWSRWGNTGRRRGRGPISSSSGPRRFPRRDTTLSHWHDGWSARTPGRYSHFRMEPTRVSGGSIR